MNATRELKAAAKKVRLTAIKAFDLPMDEEAADWLATYDESYAGLVDSDWRWVAFMHPGLAEPLSASLDAHADQHSTYDCDWAECPMVALACAINGTKTTAGAPA